MTEDAWVIKSELRISDGGGCGGDDDDGDDNDWQMCTVQISTV